MRLIGIFTSKYEISFSVIFKATLRAFYGLQGAGLDMNDTRTSTIIHIYSAAVRPVLLHDLQCAYQNKSVMISVEMLQSKLLQFALGLKRYRHNAPFLQAINIPRVKIIIEQLELLLCRSMFVSKSRCHKFYTFLLLSHLQNMFCSQNI